MKGSCHCGNVNMTLHQNIEQVTSCNCSLCYRYGAIWAYFAPSNVEINQATVGESYQHGDKCIEFHHCPTCKCITHYTPTAKGNVSRMAVNLRLFDKAVLDTITIRYFDGADTWQFIDKTPVI